MIMETREIKKSALWYASYSDDQGKALIKCMLRKIIQQDHVIQTISAELELCDDPKEERPEVILESIKSLIAVNDLHVSVKEGWFEWTA